MYYDYDYDNDKKQDTKSVLYSFGSYILIDVSRYQQTYSLEKS